MNYAIDQARNAVDQLFASPRSRLGPLTRMDEGRELLPGVLFQFQMEGQDDTVRMQLYCGGLGETGRELWRQELRALNRLSDLGHPHLPTLRDGDYEESGELAWIATNLSRYSLDVEGAMAFMAQHPLDALEQLIQLADALSQMHGRALLHRNIWPGAIEVVREPDTSSDEPIILRLARFEMSSLVSHLLRHLGDVERSRTEGTQKDSAATEPADAGDNRSAAPQSPVQPGASVRPLYFAQGLAALDGCPPERLAFLYPGSQRDALEDGRSDIYGLGMLAYRWFIDPQPELELAEIFQPDHCDWQKLKELSVERGRKIAESEKRVPRALAELIRNMLDFDLAKRPTPYELLQELAENYSDIVAQWLEGVPPSNPHLIGVFASEFSDTFYSWGWITQHPGSPAGWQELKSFLEHDLRGGVLVYSPAGFSPYSPSTINEVMRVKAKYVLLGRSAAYFSSLYEESPTNPFLGQGARVDIPELLQIRFPLRLDRGEHRNQLSSGWLQQRLPELEFRKTDPTRSTIIRDQRPSWQPLLKKVQHMDHQPPWKIEFERAFTLLLEIHKAELDMQRYPFELAPDQQGGAHQVLLRWDKSRDEKRIYSDSLLLAFSTLERRADFGDFFDSRENEKVTYFSDNPADRRGTGFFKRKHDSTEIVVERSDNVEVPARGWIQPDDNNASFKLWQRQRQAKDELFEYRGLLDQLHAPRSVVPKDERWMGAGEGLKGPAAKVVEQILATDKLYAVHGPPGTGKTTVAARAIQAQLREDPSQRILVTSQSHFSLDNMAERIMSQLERHDLLAVRVASLESETKVSDVIQKLMPRSLADTRIRSIEAYCSKRLTSGNDSPAIRDILSRWRGLAASSVFEIIRRIRRGANLVFATCGAATPQNLDGTTEQDELFNWVIVEEAARAWPTELAIPLVRGQRWTLIGDYHQLPAFGRERLVALLELCAASPDPELCERTQNRESLLRWYDLFKHLFDSPSSGVAEGNLLWHPHGVLTRQFRMREPIARLVSEVFYDGKLQTDESTEKDHGLSGIPLLSGESLVWLDTSEEPSCFDQPRWRNNGEAEIVASLVKRFRGELPGNALGLIDRIAVLTPYWDQIHALREHFGKLGLQALSPLISTVDSFQGKEADIVIVSLVRQNERKAATARLGHLVSPARVNVLLSRGRQLLILVGSWHHFESSQIPFWKDICRRFPTGRRLSPAKLLGQGQERRHGGAA